MSPESFSQLLRRLRESRGWSQQRLADALCESAGRCTVTRQEVHRWERGIRRPKFWLHHIAAVLGVPREELERASVTPPAPELDDLLPTDSPMVHLSARPGRRIGVEAVELLSSRVHALRLADDVLAGKDLIEPAFRELTAATTLLREGSHSGAVSAGLHGAIAELTQIAGWIASDAGLFAKAEETYRMGLSAAREANDSTLAGQIAGCLAYQWSNTGRERDGVALAEAALAEAGVHAPSQARALFWDRVAWAHAKMGDATATTRALDSASMALDGASVDEAPSWLYWVNSGELKIMEARAYTELRRPIRAIPLLNDVLSRYDPTHTREFALYMSWLAIAYCDANEPERASDIARQLFDMTTHLGSARTEQRAADVRAALRDFRHIPEVRAVLKETA